MIRMSNHIRRDLAVAIGRAVMAFQDATDEVDEAAARRLGLNRTDLRCLSVLSQRDGLGASELAAAAGLTRGAMTTVLDRLEASGYARRAWDRQDRRAVRVEMTAVARKRIDALYRPLARSGARLLATYSTAELAAALRYLEDGRRLQRAHAQRLRSSSNRA